jgi:hypothetical protein
MRAFAVWLATTLVAFGVLGGSYHLALTGEPRKVLVIVDSSFAMKPVWPKVRGAVREIGDRRYARFGLITEKNRVHGWRRRLELGRAAPYAPRDFAKLRDPQAFPEIGEATEVFLLTNAPGDQTRDFGGWTIIRP